jgi:hypothetical protein
MDVAEAVELTEDDIPGAVIEHPESASVPQLKWWLICRGFEAPSSWRKANLIEKFVRYYFSCVVTSDIELKI